MYSGCLLVSSHPHILISLGSSTLSACWYSCILTSSYPYVHVLWVFVNILASSHPHILRFMYFGYLLVSSHSHTLRFMYCRCLLISSHPHNLPDPAITHLYKTKQFYITLYWLSILKSMEFAWDIPNVTFEWFKRSNELKSNFSPPVLFFWELPF